MNTASCRIFVAITMVLVCGPISAQELDVSLSDAAFDAANEMAALKDDLRSENRGGAANGDSMAVRSASYVEEQLRLLSSEDRGRIGSGERARIRIANIVVGLEQLRVDAQRNGIVLPDTAALEESIRAVSAALKAEAEGRRRVN